MKTVKRKKRNEYLRRVMKKAHFLYQEKQRKTLFCNRNSLMSQAMKEAWHWMQNDKKEVERQLNESRFIPIF